MDIWFYRTRHFLDAHCCWSLIVENFQVALSSVKNSICTSARCLRFHFFIIFSNIISEKKILQVQSLFFLGFEKICDEKDFREIDQKDQLRFQDSNLFLEHSWIQHSHHQLHSQWKCNFQLFPKKIKFFGFFQWI